jgi:pyrimidine-specific ribonucleoside hydrolase
MTYAGNAPPLSCFNDGIQIATGATIGQGLIQISDSVSDIPSVMFEFNSQKIKMSLKQPIVEQMKKDISYGIQTYGLESDKYWLYIEELALKYWSDFDRHTIFTISEL